MALDVKTFRIRSFSAVFFVVIMLCGLLINWWSFALLLAIILTGCLFELRKLLNLIYGNDRMRFIIAGFFYNVLPLLMLLDLGTHNGLRNLNFKEVQYAPHIPLIIIFSIWINDTMAYIVGSFIGKTPFSKISPKKTWEGTAGGAILCVVVITLLSLVIPSAKEMALIHYIIISSLCAVFGTLGDLLESKLKRMAGIKDSGRILPGHGGFLDRFDSLLVAVPFVWLYVRFFT